MSMVDRDRVGEETESRQKQESGKADDKERNLKHKQQQDGPGGRVRGSDGASFQLWLSVDQQETSSQAHEDSV